MSARGSAKPKSRAGSGKGREGSAKKGGAAGAGDAAGDDGRSKADLEAEVKRLTEELAQEREERNYFQLERDRINSFWDITKQELAESKAELLNRDREQEELEEKHQVEIKVYKQKVKHLLYEYQNNIAHLQSDSERALQLSTSTHLTALSSLKSTTRALKLELKELSLSHADVIKSLKQKHDQEITKLRADFDRKAKELHAKYEKRGKGVRDELELKRKNEIHEIEERKNGQINALMRNHDRAFAEIKTYYNEITMNNLNLINTLKRDGPGRVGVENGLESTIGKGQMDKVETPSRTMRKRLISTRDSRIDFRSSQSKSRISPSLTHPKNQQEQVETLKKKEERSEKQMTDILSENKRLSEPLQSALAECDALKRELQNYTKDKMSLQNAKARLKVLEQEHKELRWEHEVLEQRLEGVVKERDGLYEGFVDRIIGVQRKTGFKNLILEKKVDSLKETLEKKDLQLNEVLKATNLDPAALSNLTRRLEEVLDTKNQLIKELQYDLAKVTKAHNDMIRVYEAKLTEFSIPVEELGFKPLMISTGSRVPNVGAAGLVAAQ
ncbi:Dynein regulatory complex subunit 4 [Rhizophlyctis rosea]|uniref:Dynein regulatory complex subunit 4 n=1 Tax=Rhizophlyctis rosea TaxID=64517 RepID=A0AAD5SB59_9FUNG|nr:Dynein regulatory complex subunit 4 [Rhizophlyctis rosea]